MKLQLKLFMALMFVWGCAVQADEQMSEQAVKQISETVNQDSQGEKKSSSDDAKAPEDEEEEPECE